ncbi:MAG: hypothetical protein SH847_05250 [Roseiflexaceae bacterium]|nr:hypothetical protein [Roseiflexaceae bacterium]
MPTSLRPYLLATMLFVIVLLLAFAIPSAARPPLLLGIMASLSIAFVKSARSQ